MTLEEIKGDLVAYSYIDKNVDARLVDVTLQWVFDAVIYPLNAAALEVEPAEFRAYYLPVLGWYVQAEVVLPLSFKSKNAGVVRNTGDYQASALEELKAMRAFYLDKAEVYLKRLEAHLSSGVRKSVVKHCPILL